MGDVVIDASTFHKRLSIIQKNLVQADSFAGLLYIVGASDDDNTYKKPTVLQTWLLGYEFVHTALYITADRCVFITSESKTKHIKHLAQKPTANSSEVDIWTRTKDADKNRELFVQLVELLKGDKPIGHVEKAKYKGKFVAEWGEVLAQHPDVKFADSSALLSVSMELKDADEFGNIATAAKASVAMMDIFTNEMMKIVDEETKITHVKLSENLEDKIARSNWYNKSALGKKLLGGLSNFDPELLDWCYSPIIQSGTEFDLKPSAQSTSKPLVGNGVILASLGTRYNSYCTNVARTFLIDPTKSMEDNYDFLLKLQNHIITELLKDGKLGKDVYQGALDFVKKEKPDLLPKFTKNCGWLMGLEFRDSLCVLNGKCDRKLVSGQVYSFTIGFTDLVNESNKKPYALLLSDTIKISESEPIELTNYSKNRSEVSFYFKDDNKIKDELDGTEGRRLKSEKEFKNEQKALVDNGKPGTRKKLRNEASEEESTNNDKVRQQAQIKLHQKRLQDGLARFSKADATDESDFKPVFKKYDSYIKESQIPSNVRDLKIHVDYKNQTIILPICGRPVPFHINSFKNGSQNEEGDYTYLRLNFNSAGAGGNLSKRAELPYEDSPDNTFLRSLTFRSRDRQRMVDVYKAIQDLKKDSVKREQEKKQMADVVTQATLIELKGARVKKLENVLVRPQTDSKKIGGVLSIHENGLRYQSSFRSDQKIDIIFSNIKHLFFQPCKDELIVVIHCHLKTPIMIGKKKTYDVQFYREASDMSFDETGGRKRRYRYGDEDELQQEQEERRRKALLDKEFNTFAQVIVDSSHGRIDYVNTPIRELGFQGVPFRSAVFCMPTRDCLIQLIDPPYLVITLEEIEVAHLERVQFGLKNFDLVLVFKDFSKPVVHINTIAMDLLEDVKNWLTEVDIPISEGQMNLNWAQIMKTVQADPYQFFADGGWVFLTGTGESSDEEEESEESEFEVSDDDPSDEDVSEQESDNDKYSSDGSGSDDFEESEGEDWDEMEKKAAREDKQFRE